MTEENVPKKSSFGNKFSNFWFWFETGIKLDDTQSGYRLYPLNNIPNNFFTCENGRCCHFLPNTKRASNVTTVMSIRYQTKRPSFNSMSTPSIPVKPAKKTDA